MSKLVAVLCWLFAGVTAAVAVLAVPPAATPRYPILPYTWFFSFQALSSYDQALVMDAHNCPHLLYQEPNDEVLRYVGCGWRYEAIADVGLKPPGLSFDLAVTPGDTLCLTYATETESLEEPLDSTLQYGCRGEDGWQVATIDNGGRLIRLALGAGDQPHIALIQDNAVVYLTDLAGGWQKDIIATDSGYLNSLWLLLDSAGRPHAVYSGSDGTFEAVLAANGLWIKTPLDVTGTIVPQLDSQDRLWWATVVTTDQGGHPPVYDSAIYLHRADSPFEDSIASRHDWRYAVAFVLKDGIPHLVYNSAPGELTYIRATEEGGIDHPFAAVSDGELNLASSGYQEPTLSFVSASELYLASRGVDGLYTRRHYLPGIVGNP